MSGPAASKYAHTAASSRSGMKWVCTSIRCDRPLRRRNSATRSRSAAAVYSRRICAHSEPASAASVSSCGSSTNAKSAYCVIELSGCGTDGVPLVMTAS